MKKEKITCCPHCGNSLYLCYTKVEGIKYYTFNGDVKGFTPKKESKYVYCGNCNEKITTLERLFEQAYSQYDTYNG